MSGTERTASSPGPPISSDALYAALPPVLGGDTAPPPTVPLSLRSLLPRARNAPPLPSDATLHAAVRNRSLLIDKERGGRSSSAGAPPRGRLPETKKTLRRRRRGAGDAPVVKPKAVRRARGAPAAIPLAERVYEAYAPLRELWADYAAQVVGDDDWSAIGERLVRLDWHGAVVEVTRARDPSLIGIKGTLIIETANRILVITEGNRVITVPKAAALIAVNIANRRFEIALPMLPYRASERSARKFKKKHLALF